MITNRTLAQRLCMAFVLLAMLTVSVAPVLAVEPLQVHINYSVYGTTIYSFVSYSGGTPVYVGMFTCNGTSTVFTPPNTPTPVAFQCALSDGRNTLDVQLSDVNYQHAEDHKQFSDR